MEKEGNRRLYDYCGKREIPHERIGKLIVATNQEEIAQLHEINEQADKNGLPPLKCMSGADINKIEPLVNATEALFSKNTGIIDSHALMRSLAIEAVGRGVITAYRSEATAIHYDGQRYRVEINESEYAFDTKIIINAAGLFADKIAQRIGLDIDREGYRLNYCKGSLLSQG